MLLVPTEDARDWEKYGTFVRHDPGGGPAGVAYDAKGTPVKPYTAKPKKGKAGGKKKAK